MGSSPTPGARLVLFDISSRNAVKIAATTDISLIMKRIKERESSNIELKSSFRYDMKNRQPNPKLLEKVIAKTIA